MQVQQGPLIEGTDLDPCSLHGLQLAWQRMGRWTVWRCVQVQQVFLIEVTDLDQYILDLERAWVVDRTTRKLSRCAVQRSPKLDEESEAYGGDIVLRIRCAWPTEMHRLTC